MSEPKEVITDEEQFIGILQSTLKIRDAEVAELKVKNKVLLDEKVKWVSESFDVYRTLSKHEENIAELRDKLSQFVRAVRYTSGVSLEFATKEAEDLLKSTV